MRHPAAAPPALRCASPEDGRPNRQQQQHQQQQHHSLGRRSHGVVGVASAVSTAPRLRPVKCLLSLGESGRSKSHDADREEKQLQVTGKKE